MRKRFIIRVVGSVQGVFFRVSAKEQADSLGIAGFARNEDDGSVRIEAVGEEQALASFVAWCRKGPEFAKVVSCDVKEEPAPSPEPYDEFSID